MNFCFNEYANMRFAAATAGGEPSSVIDHQATSDTMSCDTPGQIHSELLPVLQHASSSIQNGPAKTVHSFWHDFDVLHYRVRVDVAMFVCRSRVCENDGSLNCAICNSNWNWDVFVISRFPNSNRTRVQIYFGCLRTANKASRFHGIDYSCRTTKES